MNNEKYIFGGKYYEGCRIKCVQRIIRQKLINYRKLEVVCCLCRPDPPS